MAGKQDETKQVGVSEEKKRQWWKWVGMFAVGLMVGFLVLILGLGWWYVQGISWGSGVGVGELGRMAGEAWQKRGNLAGRRVNLLLVGADEEQRQNGGFLTDTIIVAAVNLEDGKVVTISLPRDLWLSDWKTKINAIYYYGQKEEGKTGAGFLSDEVEKATGLPIDYFLLVKFEALADLVDVLGGVEIDVARGFVDEKFPTADKGVETVRFEAGRQVMDGERVLKYVRSRQSADGVEGSDVARSRRQQQVVEQLAAKLAKREVWGNPELVGRLYKLWREEVETNLSDKDVLGLAWQMRGKRWQLTGVQLPTEGEKAVLTNPPVYKYGQWVWEPVGGGWERVREWAEKQLD